MKVVHVSLTPVAGSPIRLVNALNEYTSVDARSIVYDPYKYNKRTFETDLDWSKDKEKSLDLISQADIIHFHNWIDPKANQFEIDFGKTAKAGVKFVRHLHGAPERVVSSRKELSAFRSEEIFQFCPAQFQERLYPKARVIPNIVDLELPVYQKGIDGTLPKVWSMAFSPSTFATAFSDRWFTKAAPETLRILRKLEMKRDDFRFDLIRNTPHRKALLLKSESHLSVDDLVTGSYHTNSLESMALGLATFCFLDLRCETLIKELTGSSELPWINCKLENFRNHIISVLSEPEKLMASRYQSRKWIFENWHPSRWAKLCESMYKEVLESTQYSFLPRFDASSGPVLHIIKKCDREWEQRRQNQSIQNKMLNAALKLKSRVKRLLS